MEGAELPKLSVEEIELVLATYGPDQGSIMLTLCLSSLIFTGLGILLGALLF